MSIPTFTIRTKNVTASVNNDNFGALTGANNQHVAIVTKENMLNTSFVFNKCLQNLVSGYNYSYNGTLRNTSLISNSGWDSFSNMFPYGFLVLSLEQASSTPQSKISFRINNVNNNKPYNLDMNNYAAMFLSDTISPGKSPISVSYGVYDSSDILQGDLVSFDLSKFNSASYSTINSINRVIPNNGYIEFSMKCLDSSNPINNFLIISFTGTRVVNPLVTIPSTLTSDYKNVTPITVTVDKNVNGDSTNGSVDFYMSNNYATKLNSTPVLVRNGTATFSLQSKQLISNNSTYSIVAVYTPDSPYYLNTSSNYLSYTVNPHQLTLVTTLTKTLLSYNDSLVASFSILDASGTNESAVSGTVNINIKKEGSFNSVVSTSLSLPPYYVYTLDFGVGKSTLLSPGNYSLVTSFVTPDGNYNGTRDSVTTTNFTVEPFKMVITANKTNVTYDDQIVFTANNKSGDDIINDGNITLTIYNSTNTIVETITGNTYTLSPYSGSLYTLGNYTVVASISGQSTASSDSEPYSFTISSQPMTLSIQPPDSDNRAGEGYDPTVFNYSYNQPFFLTADLKTGVHQPLASDLSVLTQSYPLPSTQTSFNYSINSQFGHNLTAGTYTIANRTNLTVTNLSVGDSTNGGNFSEALDTNIDDNVLLESGYPNTQIGITIPTPNYSTDNPQFSRLFAYLLTNNYANSVAESWGVPTLSYKIGRDVVSLKIDDPNSNLGWVDFNKDGTNNSNGAIPPNDGFNFILTLDPVVMTQGGLITNFSLKRVSDNTILPQNVFSSVSLSDQGIANITIVSPEAIGATIESGVKEFQLIWTSPSTLYQTATSLAINVKGIRNFSKLVIVQNKVEITFEEDATVTCRSRTFITGGQESIASGTYSLYVKTGNTETLYGTPVYSSTGLATFTFNKSILGLYSLFFRFVATDENGVENVNYEKQKSSEISISVTQANTVFTPVLVRSSSVVKTFDITDTLSIVIQKIQTDGPSGHSVDGVLRILGGSFADLTVNSSTLSTITLDGTSYANSIETGLFTWMSKQFSLSITSFTITFTPSDSRYKTSTYVLYDLKASASNTIASTVFEFSKTSYQYLENFVFNIALIPVNDQNGNPIPITGRLELKSGGFTLSPEYGIIEVVNNIQTFSTNYSSAIIDAYEDSYWEAGTTHLLTASFTPSGFYSYYASLNVTTQINVIKQTLLSSTVTTNLTNYFYEQKVIASFSTTDIYRFSGNVQFTIQKGTDTPVVLNDTQGTNTYSITNNYQVQSLELVVPFDLASPSNTFTISVLFTSTDPNFNDGFVSPPTTTITVNKSNVNFTDSVNGIKILKQTKTGLISVNTENAFNSGINVIKGETLIFEGNLKNVELSDMSNSVPVRYGEIQIISRNESDSLETNINNIIVLKTIPVNGLGFYSNSTDPLVLTSSGEIYLSYQNTINYISKDFIYNGTNVTIPGDFYVDFMNTPYNLTMSYNQNSLYDYHDGIFEFNFSMNLALSNQSVSAISSQRANGYNVGKFLINILDSNLNIIYHTEVDPTVNENTTSGSFSFSNPRTFVLDNSSTGLNAGNYTFTCNFQGIHEHYDPSIAIDANNSSNKYITFSVAKTVPQIRLALSKNNIVYKERPYLSIEVKTTSTIDAPYQSYNDLIGTTAVSFRNTNIANNSYETSSFSNSNWPLLDVSGTGTVSQKTIVNIANIKTVQLPVIPFRYNNDFTNAGYVNTIVVVFFPTDTDNYVLSSKTISITINPYTPVLTDITFSSIDGTTASNVNDTRLLNAGVINYDEPFNINVFRKRVDVEPSVDYTAITGIFEYKYQNKFIGGYYGISDDNYEYGGPVSSTTEDGQSVKYVLSMRAEQIQVTQMNPDAQFTLSVQFIPDDNNYTRSNTFTQDFSMYVANKTGTVGISLDSYLLKYNVTPSVTIASTVLFELNLMRQASGTLAFFYDTLDIDHLIVPNSSSQKKDGMHYTSNGELNNIFSTAYGTSTLSARYEPYHIRAQLYPGTFINNDLPLVNLPVNTSDFPTITELVTRSLQINPSMVLTSSSVDGILYDGNPSVQYNSPVDYFTITSTLTTGNAPFTGGLATFTFTKQNSPNRVIVYSMPFTNDVATFTTNMVGINATQDGNPTTLFDLIQGGYVVTCHASFDGNPSVKYKDVDQDNTTAIYSSGRAAPFNISFVDNSSTNLNILYKDTKPTIQVSFTQDNVYGGSFTFVINGTNTYTMNLGNDVNSASNLYTFQIPDDLVVGNYAITCSFDSLPNFASVSNNTIHLVVNKAVIQVNPLPRYYVNSGQTTVELTATLNIPITNSTVVFVDVQTNMPFTASFNGVSYSTTITGFYTTFGYNAGIHNIVAYCTGNSNYNKSENVYTNLIIEKKKSDYVLTVGSLDDNYNYPLSLTNIQDGDIVTFYAESQTAPILTSTPSTTYIIADSLLLAGNNRIKALVSNTNYQGISNYITINKPLQTTSLVLTIDNISVPYLGPVELTATISNSRTDANINDGVVVFSVNGSVVSNVPVSNGFAVLQMYLKNIGTNTITAKYINSIKYSNSDTSTIYVQVYKENLSSLVISSTSSSNNVMDTKTFLVKLSDETVNVGTFNISVNGIVKFSDVPIKNGEAIINFYINSAITYNLVALYEPAGTTTDTYNSAQSAPITFVGVKTASLSTYYSAVTRDDTSGISNNICTVSATVTAVNSRKDLLNSGNVTFVFGGVTRIVPLSNGSASTQFYAANTTDIPTITYSNPAFVGTLTDNSGSWPYNPFMLPFPEQSQLVTVFNGPGSEQYTFPPNVDKTKFYLYINTGFAQAGGNSLTIKTGLNCRYKLGTNSIVSTLGNDITIPYAVMRDAGNNNLIIHFIVNPLHGSITFGIVCGNNTDVSLTYIFGGNAYFTYTTYSGIPSVYYLPVTQ